MYAGAAQGALGAAGLAAAVAVIDAPLRAVLLFAVAAGVIGGASALRAAWIADAPAPAAAPGARTESVADTRRRTAVVGAPALALLIAALVVGGGLGALTAGVLAGAAAGELRGARLAGRREATSECELWRELGPHPFAGPRRPLYTRPRRASTLRT
jgi:hypothetical protein